MIRTLTRLLSYFAGVILITSLLTSCAMIQEATCNTNAAYARGINDAKNHEDMQTNYASICPADIKAINNAYQDGYTTGLKKQIVIIPSSHSTYQCKTSYIKKICGYGCIKDAFNHIYCGMAYNDTCVEDAFHTIKCGLNCHVNDMNSVECDKERYSKTSEKPF